MSAQKKYKTLIVWLRRDLRVHDNSALHHALLEAEQVVPLFVLDEAILRRPDTGPARVEFLLDALRVLDGNLQKRGGRLIIRQGKTPEAILSAVQEFDADGVFFHKEQEPHGRARDEAVTELLTQAGKECKTFTDITLFAPTEILSQIGTPYTVFTPYKKVWFSRPAPPPYPAPASVPIPIGAWSAPLPKAVDRQFGTEQTFECGGEDAALGLLHKFLAEKASAYAAHRDILADDGTSRLSRHLHMGTISPRTIVAAVREAGIDKGAETFLSEIAWREFYLQILYHFPHVAEGAFRPQYNKVAWENDETLFAAWKDGRTGYPIVDAAMRQMNHEAWMHNRGRMITASFLTKDLLIDWRWGERYFMEKLVDGDQAANNGGWQWAAGTGTDAQPYFRIFNPTTQGEKFDPNGTYVKRWIPELARVPASVIHKPWTLSEAERAHFGASDYPAPIVDHAVQRTRALAMYQKAAEVTA